jgi:hypothetical protein
MKLQNKVCSQEIFKGGCPGPEFVSVNEGFFCDVAEKRLWSVCSQNVTEICFDMEEYQIGGSNFRIRDVSWNDTNIPPKSCHTAHKWAFD